MRFVGQPGGRSIIWILIFSQRLHVLLYNFIAVNPVCQMTR